ncbi:MAG: hypothetical protein ACI9MC_002720 [Kiritimatiellia bacterium]|jgi:hypothetical protein
MIWMLSGMVLASLTLMVAYPMSGTIEQAVFRRMARVQLQHSTPCDLVGQADAKIVQLQSELSVHTGAHFGAQHQLDRTEAWRQAVVDAAAHSGQLPC